MNRVVHFEIPTDNAERTSGFYSAVFGWKFERWPGPQPYWLIDTGKDGPGINGGMLPRTPLGVVNTIDVASLDDTIKAIESNGGKVIMPKFAVPTIGWLAYFSDTEGNAFGILQADAAAK